MSCEYCFWIRPYPENLKQYAYDKWGEDKGFIGGEGFYAIRQSADGYLWIGTERGLVRFDGSNFILIQRPLPDSPPISPVRGLVTDASGNLLDLVSKVPACFFIMTGSLRIHTPDSIFQDITFTVTASDDKGRVILSGLGDRTFRYEGGGRLETIVSAEQNPGERAISWLRRETRVFGSAHKITVFFSPEPGTHFHSFRPGAQGFEDQCPSASQTPAAYVIGTGQTAFISWRAAYWPPLT